MPKGADLPDFCADLDTFSAADASVQVDLQLLVYQLFVQVLLPDVKTGFSIPTDRASSRRPQNSY